MTYKWYEVEVIGYIWMPPVLAANHFKVPHEDMQHHEGEYDLTKYTGDFQSIEDYKVYLISEWREQLYNDTTRYIKETKVVRNWKSIDMELQFVDFVYRDDQFRVVLNLVDAVLEPLEEEAT